MSLAAVLICAFFGAYWMGRNAGYREGLFDGIEIEREAWNDDDGPDDDGGEEVDDQPLVVRDETASLSNAPLKLVRGRRESA